MKRKVLEMKRMCPRCGQKKKQVMETYVTCRQIGVNDCLEIERGSNDWFN